MLTNSPSKSSTLSVIFRLLLFGIVFYLPWLCLIFLGYEKANSSPLMIIYVSSATICIHLFIITYAITRSKESFDFRHQLIPIPLSFLPLTIGGTFSIVFLIDPFEQLLPISQNYQQYLTGLLQLKAYSFIAVVCVLPVLEEILFRGIILKNFLKSDSPIKAIILSSLFFAIIHFNVAQFITGFIGGLFLGYLYWQTRSLTLCIIVHVLYNGVAYFAFHLLNSQFSIESAISNTPVYLALYFVAAITLASCILIIHRRGLQSTQQ